MQEYVFFFKGHSCPKNNSTKYVHSIITTKKQMRTKFAFEKDISSFLPKEFSYVVPSFFDSVRMFQKSTNRT